MAQHQISAVLFHQLTLQDVPCNAIVFSIAKAVCRFLHIKQKARISLAVDSKDVFPVLLGDLKGLGFRCLLNVVNGVRAKIFVASTADDFGFFHFDLCGVRFALYIGCKQTHAEIVASDP